MMRKCEVELHGPGRHRADELSSHLVPHLGLGIWE